MVGRGGGLAIWDQQRLRTVTEVMDKQQALLQSPGSHIQQPATRTMEENVKKELRYCGVQLRLTPHCASTRLRQSELGERRTQSQVSAARQTRARADGQTAGTNKRWRPAARWFSAVGSSASEASPAFYRKRRGQSFEEN